MNAEKLNELRHLLEEFQRIRADVLSQLYKEFPRQCFVKVNADRFKGYGFRDGDIDSSFGPLLFPVKLENGNTWNYPVEACQPEHDLTKVPRSVRRARLKHNGYKLTGCIR